MTELIAYITYLLVKGWPYILAAIAATLLYEYVVKRLYNKLEQYYRVKQLNKIYRNK